MTLLHLVLSALVLSIFTPVGAVAQYTPGTISGTIHTADGIPLSGTKVDLVQEGSAARTFSDHSGSFTFYFVYPGQIHIRIKDDSINTDGEHRSVMYPGQTLRLQAILLQHQASNGGSGPWKINESSGTPGVWQAERVLTEERVDSLPNASHLWAFLNQTEPSVVADRYDISGLHSNRQLLLGVRGSSYTQNQSSINGISVTSPDGEGMLTFPDMSAMSSVVYSVGDSASQHMGTGTHLSLIPKTGSRKIHGQSHLYLQSGALQNVNASDRWRFFGITDSDERWRRFINGNFQIGGPLGRAPWNYFGAVSLRNHEKYIREHTLPVSGTVIQETLHLSSDLFGRDRFSLYWAGQQLSEPQANASPQVTREASIDRDQQYQTLIGSWTRSLSATSVLDSRFGIVSGVIHSRPQPGTERQNREELFPGFALYGTPDTPTPLEMVEMLSNTITGAPSLVTNSDAFALEGKVGFSTIREGFRGSSHRISAGAGFRRFSITQKHAAIDNVNLLFFKGIPESFRLLNTPVETRDRIYQLEFHVSDTVSFSRLSLSAGAYGSYANGANILSSGILANSLIWNNLSGRIGFAYVIQERRRLVLRTGLARIHNQPLTRTWSGVHPSGLGFERHLWADSDGDLQYQPGEDAGLLKVYGAPHTRLDPGLKNPHMNEISVGFSFEPRSGLFFQAFGYRRTDNNLLSLINEGVPSSSYTPVQVLDPGPDGHLNYGGDDVMLTAYNQDPATLGKDRFVLTNPAGHTLHSEGFELQLGLALGKIHAEASFLRFRAIAATAPGMLAVENDTSALLGVFDNPNKAILARASTYFDRGTTGRFLATYDFVWGTHLSTVISYLDGLPYGRYLPIQGFNQGVFGILAAQRGPGEAGSINGYRTVHYRNIDARLRKDFALGSGQMSAVIDVFNIENRAHALLQTDVTAPTHLYRIPLRYQTPRSIQLGLCYRW